MDQGENQILYAEEQGVHDATISHDTVIITK